MTKPLPGQSSHPIAMVTKTDIPGLVDVTVTTGESYRDLTMGQLRYLAQRGGWTIVPAEPGDTNA